MRFSTAAASTWVRFRNLNLNAVELPASLVEELAASEDVSYISLDKEVRASGHISFTTGAEAVRAQTNLRHELQPSTERARHRHHDSGIDPNHQAFLMKAHT